MASEAGLTHNNQEDQGLQETKILVTGSMGSGKTTILNTLSDRPPIATDVETSGLDDIAKETTTVALDFGVIKLGEEEVHVYGTPGQARFSFMWEILAQGALGVIILVDASLENPLDDLDLFLDSFSESLTQSPIVIGLTKTDIATEFNTRKISRHLKRKGLKLPCFSVDAREKQQVLLLLNAMLSMIEAGYGTEQEKKTLSIDDL